MHYTRCVVAAALLLFIIMFVQSIQSPESFDAKAFRNTIMNSIGESSSLQTHLDDLSEEVK